MEDIHARRAGPTDPIDASPFFQPGLLVMRSPKIFAALVLAGVTLAACDKGPVEWRGEPREVKVPVRGDEAATPLDARLVLREDGSPALEPIVVAANLPVTADTAACAGSLRVTSMSPTELYGVW